ncbi:MAG: EamA family transporter [Candidatus Eisenbacteria bacterium]|uniref:EamA family transporter n=1 Tax=Eiseniibacteriota bacterium TaxID=2212470 RepID=A0A948WB80_UNCEI|nr:EamA family transporter [Candidatus Eisenbacteria bacterium]MBU1949493.1 EamA family transporter [Candidatus Eisenbacteria bacterium]MBU2689723.1 EamA family transporter [Candidatus Eisenbacteria bacterium]
MVSGSTLRALGLLLIAILFTVTGELFLKHGMNRIGIVQFSNFLPTMGRIVRTPVILIGFTSIGVGAVFWLAVISRVNLSFAYPMLSVGYILILIFSALILKEDVSLLRWIGAVVICLGVYLITRS